MISYLTRELGSLLSPALRILQRVPPLLLGPSLPRQSHFHVWSLVRHLHAEGHMTAG